MVRISRNWVSPLDQSNQLGQQVHLQAAIIYTHQSSLTISTMQPKVDTQFNIPHQAEGCLN